MADLTLGFDFTQFETPTRTKFQQQALSLTLTALMPGDFAGGIFVIKTSSDSASSNALESTDSIAQLWIDGRGDLWVQEQAGPQKIYRYEMGWESRRWFCQPSGGESLQPGSPLTVDTLSEFEDFGRAQNESESTGAILQADTNDLRTNQNRMYVANWIGDTGASGFYGICGRGGMVFRHPQLTLNTTWAYDNELQSNVRMITKDFTLGDFAHHNIEESFDNNQDKFMGYVTSPSTGSSVTTDASFGTKGYRYRVEQFGWSYGIYMRGYRTVGT